MTQIDLFIKMNNQTPRDNNQTITNDQFINNQTKSSSYKRFDYWLLDIEIYLVIGAWLLVISSWLKFVTIVMK